MYCNLSINNYLCRPINYYLSLSLLLLDTNTHYRPTFSTILKTRCTLNQPIGSTPKQRLLDNVIFLLFYFWGRRLRNGETISKRPWVHGLLLIQKVSTLFGSSAFSPNPPPPCFSQKQRHSEQQIKTTRHGNLHRSVLLTCIDCTLIIVIFYLLSHDY